MFYVQTALIAYSNAKNPWISLGTNLLAWDTIRAAFPDYPYCIINSREDEVLNLPE